MTDPNRLTPSPFGLIQTPDGSRTAHSQRFGEAYGSQHGAASQARHVFLEGSGTASHPAPRVLEIGFGLGANFRTTLAHCAAQGRPLHYRSYEFDPVLAPLLREVAKGSEGSDHALWQMVLEEWPKEKAQPNRLDLEAEDHRLTLLFDDVLQAQLPPAWATAIYLDGFSPSRNPEVWTPDFVERLTAALAPGGVLATYSAAGHVRRAMQAAGLQVERRPGAPGKRECLRAVKPL